MVAAQTEQPLVPFPVPILPHQQQHQQLQHQQHPTHPVSPASDNTKAKLVKNLSSKPLTEVQISLLARDPNFAVVPLYSTKREYIMAVEEGCL